MYIIQQQKKDKGKQLVDTWISVLSIILSEVHQREKHKEWSFMHMSEDTDGEKQIITDKFEEDDRRNFAC